MQFQVSSHIGTREMDVSHLATDLHGRSINGMDVSGILSAQKSLCEF